MMHARYHLSSHRSYDGRRLAKFLASVRRQRGLEASALAERAGIDAKRLAEAEAGVAVLTQAELGQLAAALSLSCTVLLEEAGLITHLHTRHHRLRGSEV